MDLTAMTDSDLGALQLAVVSEQSRRARVASLPDDLADMTRDAVAAGVPTATLRAAIDDALTPAAEEPTA